MGTVTAFKQYNTSPNSENGKTIDSMKYVEVIKRLQQNLTPVFRIYASMKPQSFYIQCHVTSILKLLSS
jgi:hypothetical protein